MTGLSTTLPRMISPFLENIATFFSQATLSPPPHPGLLNRLTAIEGSYQVVRYIVTVDRAMVPFPAKSLTISSCKFCASWAILVELWERTYGITKTSHCSSVESGGIPRQMCGVRVVDITLGRRAIFTHRGPDSSAHLQRHRGCSPTKEPEITSS